MSRSPNDEEDRHDLKRNQANLLLSKMMLQGRSFSGHERNCCYLNCGSSPDAEGRFANISATSGMDFPDDGRALALVDWDQDGDLDLWISNRNAPRLRFLRNEIPQPGRFVDFRLVGNGTTSNRDAIGARVEVVVGETATVDNKSSTDPPPRSIKTLHAGEGFLSQNSKWLHFGLGSAERIREVTVRWPDGTRETFEDLSTNRRYVLEQGRGEASAIEPKPRELALRHEEQKVPQPTRKATLRLVSPLAMPPLSYQTLTGEKQQLKITSGRPLLVNLWATWCVPCQKEMSEMVHRAEELRAVNLDVVALSVDGLGNDDSSPRQAAKYLDGMKFPFPAGMATPDLLEQLQVLHNLQTMLQHRLPLPSSFLVNAQGRLTAIFIGPATVDAILDELAQKDKTREARFVRAAALPGRLVDHEVARRTFDMIEAERRFNYATWLNQLGFAKEATVQYQMIMELWPESAKAHVDFGGALIQQGEYEPAEEHLKKALVIEPNSSGAQLRLGNLYLRQGKLSLALASLQKARQLTPNDVSIINNLGTIYGHQGDFERAISEYRQAIELIPDDPGGYNNLAWLYATCKELPLRDGDQAILLATKACELTQWEQFTTLDTLATSYAAAGDFEEAVRWQTKALDLAPAAQKEPLQHRLERFRQKQPFGD